MPGIIINYLKYQKYYKFLSGLPLRQIYPETRPCILCHAREWGRMSPVPHGIEISIK